MDTPLLRAAEERDRLKRWLLDSAFALWWEQGADQTRGGFWERLAQDGTPQDLPKRARVLPRQIYCYAVAPQLGWSGPSRDAVEHGLSWFLAHFRRPDGLFRGLVARDGAVLIDRPALYDQAFGLFALALASTVTHDSDLQDLALGTLHVLRGAWAHPLGGFEEGVPRSLPLCSNPQMHMFEACLAWEEAGGVTEWSAVADQIAELALSHLIDQASGALREFFDASWIPVQGLDGRLVEPGHQFEWGWLLLRWGQARQRADAITAALRLITIAEQYGVDPVRGVAINALLDDLTVHDAVARLWPQTERIKAACLAAAVTGDERYWDMAANGARGLSLYLGTKVRGLWWDRLQVDGSFIEEAAPASSFYHIVCAILEFDRHVTAAQTSQ